MRQGGGSQETRERLLEAGIRMLHETGVVAGVEHVRLADVCARAAYTTGAAYRIWPTQADFHRDLAIAAIRWRDRSPVADTLASVRGALLERAPLAEVVRVGAEANVSRMPRETDYYVTLALRACALHDERLAEASTQRVAEGIAAHDQLYTALLAQYGRRPRPPFTGAHLAAAVGALAEGFAVQDTTRDRHPRLVLDGYGPGVGTDWTLFGATMMALVEGFTEPVPGAAPGPAPAAQD